MSLNRIPADWTAGEKPSAAKMNQEIRDPQNALQAPWDAYSPVWTCATTAPALGNGALVGAFFQTGKTVLWRAVLTAGSTTTFGAGAFIFSLPVAPISEAFFPVGDAILRDVSANSARGGWTLIHDGGGNAQLRGFDGTAAAAGAPFTWASGDQLLMSGSFETS